MAIIDVLNLSLKRGGQTVLSDVSLSVEQGEILVVIGPSGSGKSSLLRCLNRLEEPESGRIMLDGGNIAQLPVIELRRRVGMIFQKSFPFDGTVADNIAFGPTLNGEELDNIRIGELMNLSSLELDLIDKNARELSGGQEQRLAIARALANRPDVLLLDEPTSALDPIATRHIEESLVNLRDQLDLTLIWVSHTIEQARRIADRVLLLDEGRVLRIDTVDVMLDPKTGDKRALAFAAGDKKTLKNVDAG